MDLDSCRDMVLGILTEHQRSRLEQEWELDFALQVEGVGRFRGNAHYCRGALEAAFRHIPITFRNWLSWGTAQRSSRFANFSEA